MKQTATQPLQNLPAAKPAPVVPIASRRSCNPDGIGLSHYVLMDRKVAK